MAHVIQALKTGIVSHLAASAPVLALLRAPKVFVDPPRPAAYPFVVVTVRESRDAGCAAIAGHETHLVVAVHGRHAAGLAEVLALGEAVANALVALPPVQGGHRVATLAVKTARPVSEGELHRLDMAVRVLTEVI
jgi:Protein of unknown function (DUF3168)